MRVNFDQIEAFDPGQAILPPRPEPYICDIVTSEAGTSSGGYPQIEVQLRDTGGQGEIRDWLTISEHEISLKKVVGLIEAAGMDKPGEIDVTSVEFEQYVAQFAGRRVAVFVGQEPNRNKPGVMRTIVRGYAHPAQVGTDVPPDTAGLAPAAGAGVDLPFN